MPPQGFRVYPWYDRAFPQRSTRLNALSKLIAWIFDAEQNNSQQRDEAYIAESADLYELEYRIRQLDRRRPFGPFAQNA